MKIRIWVEVCLRKEVIGEEVDLGLKQVWRISLEVFLRIVEIKKGKKKSEERVKEDVKNGDGRNEENRDLGNEQ